MFRHSFSMFLRAFIVCVLTASLPGPAFGQDEDDAMIILYNTDRLTEALQQRQLSQIFGRGPMLAEADTPPGPMLAEMDAPRGPMLAGVDSDQGPMLAGTQGPMLAAEDPQGPMIAADNPQGPMVTGQETSERQVAEGVRAGQNQEAAPASARPDAIYEIPESQEALYRELRELRQDVDQLRQEAAAREVLRITEDEERDEEVEILEAAGREYSLMQPGLFGMDLRVNYSYNSYDVIRDLYRQQGTVLEYRTSHTISNSLTFEIPRRDNLTIEASIPFVYRYDKMGTSESMDINDLGDISLGVKYQPLKRTPNFPSPIISLSYIFPTGRGAYDIDPSRELPTGSGLHTINGGISVSQPFDPVNAFASLSYNYDFTRTGIDQRLARGVLKEVDSGDSIGASIGFGYALAYRVSLSLGLSYSYNFSTTYKWANGEQTKTGDRVSSSLSLNTAWRVTPARRIIVGVSKGLSRDSSDFALSLRLPIEFDLR